MNMKLSIIRADITDSKDIAILFDLYRIFYGQASDKAGALSFIKERLAGNESVIFLAKNQERASMGFTQLYLTFSSQSMQKLWVLNDLYVHEGFRNMGVASELIRAAKDHASQSQSKGLLLCTQHSNSKAQNLYKKVGFRPLDDYQWHFLAADA